MFGKQYVADMINRSTTNEADRRTFLRAAGVAGLGVVGTAALAGIPGTAHADTITRAPAIGDPEVLNFALNLEYLEAEFYLRAVYGRGLDHKLIDGTTPAGSVRGGREVCFSSRAIANYAREIANDELAHVKFLRAALGNAKVSRPKINLQESFTAAAQAAGLIGKAETFDPFKNEDNFLLAAFIFEDVGVTAYKGAAPLITNKTYLEAAAGILAVEAYHAGIVRATLYAKGQYDAVQKISDVRDAVDGKTNDDQGIGNRQRANLVPTDDNAIAFSRTTGAVLNVVYLTPNSVKKGGFYPEGVNGVINTSENNA